MRTGWHNRKKIVTAQRFIFKYVNDFLVVAVVIVKVPYLAGGNARVELVLFLLSLIGNDREVVIRCIGEVWFGKLSKIRADRLFQFTFHKPHCARFSTDEETYAPVKITGMNLKCEAQN